MLSVSRRFDPCEGRSSFPFAQHLAPVPYGILTHVFCWSGADGRCVLGGADSHRAIDVDAAFACGELGERVLGDATGRPLSRIITYHY